MSTLCSSFSKPFESTSTSIFEADGFRYHAECFTCDKCSTSLTSGVYIEIEGQRLCQKCRAQDVCQSCGYAIGVDKSMEVDNQLWHKDCFVCVLCRTPLKKFFEKDSLFYCATCVNGKTPKMCCKCSKPIEVGKAKKALGKSWHESCYVCHNCGGQLEKNHKDKNGFPYCSNCERKAIPTRRDIAATKSGKQPQNLKSNDGSIQLSSSPPSYQQLNLKGTLSSTSSSESSTTPKKICHKSSFTQCK